MAVAAGAIRAGRAFVELFADSTKLEAQLRLAQNKVKEFGTQCAQLGTQIALSGAVFAVPFAFATKIFSEFDDQMRAVQAVTGSTGAQFEQLTEKAKLLGRTTSFTAAQVASGMLELGRAGFAAAEIDKSIKGVMDLARSTQTEIPRATEIAGNALRGFTLDADQMGRVTDVLAVTANRSAQTLDDLGESFKYVAPIANSAGMSLEDTAKVLGSLANFGIKGSMAGTSVKNILTRMADTDVQKMYNKIGVEVTDSTGKLRNMATVLHEVGAATASLPNAERLAIFKELFDMRALAGGDKLTTANFTEMFDAIDNATGEAARMANDMDQGIGGSFRMFMSALEGVAIAIGESLSPEIQRITKNLTACQEKFASWISTHKGVIVVVAKLAAGLVLLGGTLLALGAISAAVNTAITVTQYALAASKYATVALQYATVAYKGVLIATQAALAAWHYILPILTSDVSRFSASQLNAVFTITNLKKCIHNLFAVQLKAGVLSLVATFGKMKDAIMAINYKAYFTSIIAYLGQMKTAFFAMNFDTFKSSFSSAMKFISSSLKMLSVRLVAGGAAIAALLSIPAIMKSAATYTAEFSNEFEELQKKGIEKRIGDDKNIDYLKKMAEGTAMTDEQFIKAAISLSELEKQYGSFGVTLDSANQKLIAQKDAFKKLDERQREKAVQEANDRIGELLRNNEEAKKEQESFSSVGANMGYNWSTKYLPYLGGIIPGLLFSKKGSEVDKFPEFAANQKRLNELQQTVINNNKEIKKQQDLIARINEGSDDALRGKSAKEEAEAKIEKQFRQNKAETEFETKINERNEKKRRDSLSAQNKEKEDIEKEYAEYRGTLEAAIETAKKGDTDVSKERLQKLNEQLVESYHQENEELAAVDEKYRPEEKPEKPEPPEKQIELKELEDQEIATARNDVALKEVALGMARQNRMGISKAEDDLAGAQAKLKKLEYWDALKKVEDASKRWTESKETYDKVQKTGTDNEKAIANNNLADAQTALNQASSDYRSILGGAENAEEKFKDASYTSSSSGTFSAFEAFSNQKDNWQRTIAQKQVDTLNKILQTMLDETGGLV